MLANRRYIIPALVIIFIILIASLNNKDAMGAIQPNNTGADSIKSVILDDFENCEDWVAKATCPLGETKVRKVPGKPADLNNNTAEKVTIQNAPQGKTEFVLGVKTYFREPGYDRVEISPPQPIEILGKCRYIAGWVLGRGYYHRLFIKILDYRKRPYLLPAKYLNEEGWQQFQIYIPGYIKQGTVHTMSPLHPYFKSFVVIAGLHEVRGTFYVYFDHLIAHIDQFGQEYDGAEIRDEW